MGWLWGGKTRNDDKDPTKSLDPTLKEFLDSQQPRPYVPAQAPAAPVPAQPETLPSPQASEPSNSKKLAPDSNAEANSNASADATVPSASLFPDGRYAHLWTTYTPEASLTATTTSPLERIVSARKDRRELVSRAAMENCAFEQELQRTCFAAGTAAQRAKARLTLCREETKAFNRCYALQGKFLQALGYLGRADSTDDEDERVQMHADALYHRMMDYEAAVDRARRAGTPVPPLASVFEPGKPSPSLQQQLGELQPAGAGGGGGVPGEAKMLKRQAAAGWEELPPQERELAVRAALQEAKMTWLYSEEMRTYARQMDAQRKERRRWLSGLVGEPIGNFVIPDPLLDADPETTRRRGKE